MSHEQFDVWPRPNGQKDLWAFTVIYSYYLSNVGSCYLKNKVSRKRVSPEVLDFSIQSDEKTKCKRKRKRKKKNK